MHARTTRCRSRFRLRASYMLCDMVSMHARTRRCRSGFRAGRASHSGDMVCMHARTRRWGSRVELPGTGAGWQIARVVVASRVVWLWLSVGTARDSRERERRGERSISRRLRSGFTRGSSCVLRGFGLVCLLVYGIPTFDSESFELELGTQWESMGHLWLQSSVSSKSLQRVFGVWRSGFAP